MLKRKRISILTKKDKDDFMNKKRGKIAKFMNTTVWIIILLLFSYVLMKSCLVYSNTNMRQTVKDFGDELVMNFSNQLIISSSPLLQYVSATDQEGHNENELTRFVNHIFPINHYSLDAFNENVKSENEAYATKSDSLSYNSDELLKMIEENQESYTEEYEEEESYDFNNDISFIRGETYLEEVPDENSEESKVVMANNVKLLTELKAKKDFEYLISNFYIVDSSTNAIKQLFNVSSLLKRDMTLKQKNNKPQILIYHTHSQESFVDSEKGKADDTIVGVGTRLAEILTEQYGYNVIHDTTTYDFVDGKLDRNKAYNYALPAIKKILEKNPTIEVIIDLHRDGVAEGNTTRLVTNIGGKKTAQLMFLNGLSRNRQGPIEYLENPHISENLAFSLQLHIKSLTEYPKFTKKIYLRNYRFNQHLIEKTLLVELGNQNNTVLEAKNAMEPLANLLNQVLEGK